VESILVADWNQEVRLLSEAGVTVSAGLSEAELRRAEQMHRFRFPPDLRSLLSVALPLGRRFPDWREPDSPTDAEVVLAYSVRYFTAFFARELLGDAAVGAAFEGAGASEDVAAGHVTVSSK
jgi:hypothetical protein